MDEWLLLALLSNCQEVFWGIRKLERVCCSRCCECFLCFSFTCFWSIGFFVHCICHYIVFEGSLFGMLVWKMLQDTESKNCYTSSPLACLSTRLANGLPNVLFVFSFYNKASPQQFNMLLQHLSLSVYCAHADHYLPLYGYTAIAF